MSKTDARLRDLGQAAEMRRSESRERDSYTYTYQGLRNRRHRVRRSDGRFFYGSLATNGAIALGQRVRFTNRQIDAMPYQPPIPQEPNRRTSPQFLGEVLVVFVEP